jgi:hypothetical protein
MSPEAEAAAAETIVPEGDEPMATDQQNQDIQNALVNLQFNKVTARAKAKAVIGRDVIARDAKDREYSTMTEREAAKFLSWLANQ